MLTQYKLSISGNIKLLKCYTQYILNIVVSESYYGR